MSNCFQFECDDGRCVPFNVTCNGVDDCGDLSDEILCGMYCSTCVVGLLLLGSQCEASRGNDREPMTSEEAVSRFQQHGKERSQKEENQKF